MVRAAKPLDPRSAKLCAYFARQPTADSLQKRRDGYDELMMRFPASPGITAVDILVPSGNADVPCRLYWTGAMTNPYPRPVVIYFHGGGHVIGSVAGYDNYCRNLCAAAGVQVLSVDYRLSPENPYPIGMEDCYEVLRWVVDGHGSSYGIDGSRVALAGDSAGGNITLALCLMARDDGIAGNIRFALALVPEVDNRAGNRFNVQELKHREASVVVNASGYFLQGADVEYFSSQYLPGDYAQQANQWRCSPIAGDLSGLPKMLVITAGYDLLRDEGEAFARLAKAAGSPVEHECQEDEFHCWFLLGKSLPQAREAVARFGKLLRAGVGLPPPSRL